MAGADRPHGAGSASPEAFRSVGAGGGALLSGLHFGVTVLVTFFLAPYMLRRLGDTSYGLLSVAWELSGYFGLLDFGLRNAIGYYVARAAASGEQSGLRTVIRNAFWLLCGITGIGLLASWPLAALAVRWIRTGPLDESTVRSVLCLSFAVLALNLTGTLAGSVLSGLRRYDWLAATNIAGTLASGLFVFAAIEAGAGLLFVALAQAAGTMLPWVAQQFILHRWKVISDLWPPALDKPVVKQLTSYGSANLLMRVSELLAFQTDQLVIVQHSGPAAVARYHIGRYLALHARRLTAALSAVLAPYFTALSASGQKEESRTFFLRVNRWTCSLAFLLLGGVTALGQPFLALWVGPRYLSGGVWERSDTVLLLYGAAMILRSLMAVPYQYLLGTRRLRVPTAALAVEALFIVAGGVFAIRWKGLAAVALVKLASSIGIAVFTLVPYALRESGIPVREYLLRSIVPALLTGAATGVIALLFRHAMPVSSWAQLFLAASVSAAAGAAAFLAMSTAEDREFLRRKLRTPLG